MERILRVLREYARRYLGWYALGLGCLVATNILTVSIPGFVQRAVDALDLGQGAAGAEPWAWAIVGTGLAIMVVRTLSRTLFFNPGRTIEFRLKSHLFEKLLRLPQAFFDRMSPGDLISRGTNDVNAVRALAGYGILQVFNTILAVGLTVGKMATVDARLTLLCVLPLAVAVVILRMAVRRMFVLAARFQVALGTLNARILETYNGVSVLQAYGGIDGATERFDEVNTALLDISLGLVRIRSWLLPVVSVVGNVCVVIVLWDGGSRVGSEMTVGEIASFVVYINVLVASLTSVGWLINSLQRGWVSLGRIYEIMDAAGARVSGAPLPPGSGSGGRALSVRDLTFCYPGSEVGTLEGISFDVAAGETLGVFGPTGAGKTTLLRLLARVYEPPPGTITLDGADVGSIASRDYWAEVAYVLQEPFLFSQSIRANTALGAPDDADVEARVRSAIEDAAMAPDLTVLPDGLDTVVGERGVTLSGGQRQRVALARAFYRPYGVLLLDDVMSAVDHDTERQLIDAIYRRGQGATTVIVSHRLSVLMRADRVLVFEGGRVVDTGTHEELVARGEGPYFRAWRLQQAVHVEPDVGGAR